MSFGAGLLGPWAMKDILGIVEDLKRQLVGEKRSCVEIPLYPKSAFLTNSNPTVSLKMWDRSALLCRTCADRVLAS
jgi:hypothetical protein